MGQSTDFERLRRAVLEIKANGLVSSNTEMAKKIGYNRSYLQNILKGDSNGMYDKVPMKFLQALENEYQVNKVYVAHGVGSLFLNDSETKEILETFEKIDAEDVIEACLKYSGEYVKSKRFRDYIRLLASEIEIYEAKIKFGNKSK